LRNDLIEAYLHLKCYADVPDTPAALKDSSRQIAIFSNG